jgi:hypothetical protein
VADGIDYLEDVEEILIDCLRFFVDFVRLIAVRIEGFGVETFVDGAGTFDDGETLDDGVTIV